MPPTNPARRQALTDGAIDLLAASGVHGVTHRAVENAAALPPGTASNYFPSREALLVATARRIVELHHADMDRTARHHHTDTATPPTHASLADRLAALLTDALLTAATTLRTRYRAIYELQLEAVRRPALASALAGLQDSSIGLTADHHGALGLPIPAEAVPTLVTLYGGALFVLVTTPVDLVNRQLVEPLARAIVRGALPDPGGSTTQ
ncbi:transcriptional regulator, TetR family [Micromonospora echinaurantiaca]|uniref:Transcriptional regulator, TetR family n=1 Tax=Micromonospora echinaurantiaca TaxID=47857 RepID=A0A1C5I421_9ACTN|nr:TetR/AcrR family transcriptional regulator [Micromonospora echinaurantiaca]SCG53080.1 transcriptional regulator, TetR family [Micromonospora echinaurantiaca]